MDYPEVSICIPVYERNEFLYLTLSNIKRQTYPQDKLTVIIDECKSNNPFITDISQVRQYLHPIKLIHKVYNSRSGIGEKRNRLVKTAQTKYIQFFDTDDFYFNKCIQYNYESLIQNKVKCCGSNKMSFCYIDDKFKLSAIDCGDIVDLIHEATLFMDKKWFQTTNKFSRFHNGEGRRLFEGVNKKYIHITDVNNVMICLVHKSNTVSKEQFSPDVIYKETDTIKYLDDDLQEYLKTIIKQS